MNCEYNDFLDIVERNKTSLRFKIGEELVQVEQVSRIRKRKFKAGSRCLLEEVLGNNPVSDIVTIDPKKGVLCGRCGKRIKLTMKRVRPEGIRQRRRRR